MGRFRDVVKRYRVRPCELSEIEHFNALESNKTSQISEGKTPISWFAAEDAETGELLGSIGILMIGKTAHGRGLFVLREHRGAGLGSCLVREMERLAREFGASVFKVKTAEHGVFNRVGGYKWTGKEYKTFNGREYVKEM